MKLKSILLILAAASFMTCPTQASKPIIPQPRELNQTTGNFMFPNLTTYSVTTTKGDSIDKVVDIVGPHIEKAAGITLAKAKAGEKGTINFNENKSLPSEGYKLNVYPTNIEIEAADAAGFYYGLQTLRMLLPFTTSSSPVEIECVEIEDSPRFGWRGFMLDEGRHFFGKDEVKKILDLMSLYKMNRFHWHLTEDQGWRLEIKKYPKLTEVGANRKSTSLGWRNNLTTDTFPYGGYYSHADIKEIVDYAKDRFIEIVPEIDIPGHTQAAVAAYPEFLACDPENPHEVWLRQGVSTDVMNVANPQAVQMSKDIIDELIELFPFGYIHLGGDECPTVKWEQNAECKTLLASLGSDNYRDLQLNFYKELVNHISTKPKDQQRKLIFWNEVLHGNTDLIPNSEDITVMAWVGADKAALDAANRGMKTILTPQIPYYINRKQSPSVNEPVSQGWGKESLDTVYGYDPLKNVPAELADKYMGVQANFWSEYVITPEFLEYLMLPRLVAVAEAGWTPQSKRSYPDFRERVRAHKTLFDNEGWNYGKHEFQNETIDPITNPFID
ncbi:MAG: beta-N-acetylhexosaminidase [Paramuribaculum sp.]|nr:beta-N-acetylhexosaminidase [Paramuribaculum sp.]